MFYKELRITDVDYLNNLKEDVKKNIKKSFTNVTNIQGHMTFYRHYIDNKLFEKIKEMTPEYVWYDAWGSLLKKGHYIREHDHRLDSPDSSNILTHSGVIYLTDIKPGTYFKKHDITIEPEVGKIIIFSAHERHGVATYNGDRERITYR